MSVDDNSWERWEPNIPSPEIRDSSLTDEFASADDWSSRAFSRQALLRAAAGGVLAAGVVPGLGCSGSATESGAESGTGASTEDPAREGGRLRLALRGTTPVGRDPHKAVSHEEASRTLNLFDTLAELNPDSTVDLRLAELIEPNKTADVWDIRVRDGATWHDGKPVTAEDIIYSLRRILNEDTGSTGRSAIISIDPNRLRKLDGRTVRLFLNRQNGDLPIGLTNYAVVIVQQGATDFDKTTPIGSGPFMFKSWDVGRRSLFVKNPNYWRSGWPILDELEIIDIADNDARINALLGGEADLVHNVAPTRAKQLLSDSGIEILLTPNFGARMITMAVDIPPYDDNRVRQAVRLAVNRQQYQDIVLAGFGEIANDMFGRGQALYNSSLPQRTQDTERAQFLLKQAGREGFSDTLYTSTDPAVGQLFAEQMRAIGVNIELAVPSEEEEFTIGPGYLKWPLGQTGYGNSPITVFMDLALTETAPYNETHWFRPAFQKKLREGQATTNFELKKEIFWELGKELYDEGGYFHWSDSAAINAKSPKVAGISKNSGTFTFGNYDMRPVHFVA